MSTFKPGRPCTICASRAEAAPYNNLCDGCTRDRQGRLEALLRDRSYRRHLARQVAGLPCDNKCPETTCGPATFQLQSAEYHTDFQLGELAFEEFKRPSHLKISSYELLAAHHDSTEVWYCDICYGAAIHGAEENSQVSLCASCLGRRDTHVNTVHWDRGSFYGGQDCLNLRSYVVYWEVIGMADNLYDSWFEAYVQEAVGGGGGTEVWIFGALAAGFSVHQIWREWQKKRHNDRMYEQGQENLRNADRSHALDLAKQRVSMSKSSRICSQPSFEQFMQNFDEMQARVDGTRRVPEPDVGTSKFWGILAGVGRVPAAFGGAVDRSSEKVAGDKMV